MSDKTTPKKQDLTTLIAQLHEAIGAVIERLEQEARREPPRRE